MTTSRLPAVDAPPTSAAPDPTAPDMTEVINPRTGSVRVSGRLTEQGAELLRGTVETLHRRGHACVVLDLQGLHGTEDAGLHVLRDLRRTLTEDGGRLLVLPAPAGMSAEDRGW